LDSLSLSNAKESIKVNSLTGGSDMFNGGLGPFSPSISTPNGLNLDPQFFEDLERELGPVFTLNEEQQLLQHRFSPAPTPITQSLSSQLLQPATPPVIDGKMDPTKDQIRQQIENDIHKELKQHQDMLQQQQQMAMQQKMHQPDMSPSPYMMPNYYEEPRGYNASKPPVGPSDQYEQLLSAWALEKGIDLNARKRKSEDLSDSFLQFSMKNDPDKGVSYAKTLPLNSNAYGNQMAPPVPVQKSGEFDIAYAKSQLIDLVCGEKDLQSFCPKVTAFICNYMKVRVGGFYMNQRPNPKDWLLYSAFPSATVFDTFFQFNVGFHLILQAAVEKRCFCVHSTSLSNGSLSFIFIPIPAEETGNAVGVLVLGSVLSGEDDLHTHLVFLDQIRKIVASSMFSIMCLQQNLMLSRKVDMLRMENDTLKQKNRFEKALISVISTSGPLATEGNTAIICTDIMGVITYFSPGASSLLGYSSAELVGRYTPLKLHEPNEVLQRSKEAELETGKKMNPGFSVIVDKTLRTGLDSRDWTFIRKDGSSVSVNVTVKPLYDDEEHTLIGFLEVAKPLGQ
jgi:PAS domain-containing protein